MASARQGLPNVREEVNDFEGSKQEVSAPQCSAAINLPPTIEPLLHPDFRRWVVTMESHLLRSSDFVAPEELGFRVWQKFRRFLREFHRSIRDALREAH